MRCVKRIVTQFCAVLVFSLTPLLSFAQDANQDVNVDKLFSESQDIISENHSDNKTAESDLTNAFTRGPSLQFSGSFSTTAGLGVGYTQWPDLKEPFKYYDGSAGAKASTTLIMRAQPSSYLSIYGDVSTSLETTGDNPQYTWTPFTIGSLYFDYFGITNLSIRAGQFETVWGHGRIFTQSNLMSTSASDLSLRLSMPLVLQGLSMFIFVNKNYFSNSPTVYEYAYAGIVDHVIGPLRITGAARYQKQEGLGTLLSLQGTIFGIDVFSDVVFTYKDTVQFTSLIGGFFKEVADTKIYAEYLYNGITQNTQDYSFGLVLIQKKPFALPLDGGIKWEHTFYDNSGQISPGITWSGLPHLTIQAALPITYGTETSRYVINNADPSKRKILFALLAKIEGSF
jgi:hypothetical protein